MTDNPDWEYYEEMRRAAAMTASLGSAFLRGRIAGLRRAAEIADSNVNCREAIRAAADKLEKGEAP